MTKIAVIGATTWGTTLSIVNATSNKDNEIYLLTRSPYETEKLVNDNQMPENLLYKSNLSFV